MLDKAAEALLTSGGVWAALWVFTVLGAGLAIRYLTQALIQCYSDRNTDSKAMAEVIHANGIAMQAQGQANEARARAQEAAARAQELAAVQAQHLTQQVSELRQVNDGLRGEIGRLNDGLKLEIAGLRAELQRRP